MRASFRPREPGNLLVAVISVVAIPAGFRLGLRLTNPTTAALTYLLVVLIIAATSRPTCPTKRSI
jgi:hypothetical protein